MLFPILLCDAGTGAFCVDDSAFPKRYDYKESESRMWASWEKHNIFRAEVDKQKTPFCVVMPPPNVTGILHMGHVLDNVPQDVVTRWHRMRGFSSLWVPGTDHAGIATQNVVKRQLDKEGINFRDLGREEFVRRVWAWKEKSGGTIIEQLKRLGCSCDWSRQRFTMDEQLSRAVTEAFVRLFDKGLIYRGKRIINWCVVCGTALANDEVEHESQQANLWYIRYPLKGGSAEDYVLVATTRPETMLGDVAVAVHPEDERFKRFHGKTLILPLVGREIPIVPDAMVDPAFGTGAVKITPAHDANDYQVSLRHKLTPICVINEDGKISADYPAYAGMDRLKARKKIPGDLEALGLLEKTEAHPNSIGKCYRCESVVEPYLSDQWFLKMRPLAEKAKEVVVDGRVKIVPESEKNDYYHWMDTIDDWCISRQLWWGHRIPAYYCTACGEVTAARETPEKCPKCSKTELRQDEDVLDTWFSSQLWPYSTLGWPEQTADLEYWYPNNWLLSGRDILFFWDARMIMSGLELAGDVPFRTLVLHGLVRDEQGRKLSKSLGNSPDPLQLFDEYGADAVRAAMMHRYPLGRQDTRLGENAFKAGSALVTKIWNSCRFVALNLEGKPFTFDSDSCGRTAFEDRWILSRLGKMVTEHDDYLKESDFSHAFEAVQSFFRNEFCDWYLEIIKRRTRRTDGEPDRDALATALHVVRTVLKVFHVYIPFVTEELWQTFHAAGIRDTSARGESDVLALAHWPVASDFPPDERAEELAREIMSIVRAVREVRSILEIAPKVPVTVKLSLFDAASQQKVEQCREIACFLANIEAMDFAPSGATPAGYVPFSFLSGVGLMKLPEETKAEETRSLLERRLKKLEPRLKQLESRLANKEYVDKAPEHSLNETRNETAELGETIKKLSEFHRLLSAGQ